MKRIDDRIEKNANNDLQIHGITLTQIQMLLALNQMENGSAALKEVEKYFGIAQSTAAGIAVRLEKKLVTSCTDAEDKRIKRIQITDAGKSLCVATEQSMQDNEHRLLSILTPVFTALEVLMEILIPFITASIIDKGIEAGDMQKVWLYGGVMLTFAFLSLILGIQAGRHGASASSGLACNLRKGTYENIQNFSFSNIDKYNTAGLVTRMTTDVTNLQNAYQMILRIAVRAPLMLICSMVMCFLINVRLSLVFLAAMLVLACALAVIMKMTLPIFTQVFSKYDDLNASVQENVSAIRVVKAFVREDHENEKFSKAAENLYRLYVKAESILSFNNPIMMLVVYGCMIALSWMGAHFIVGGALITGNLTSLFNYVLSMMMSLMMLSMIFVMVSMSMASARRIAEVLEEKPDMTNPSRPKAIVPDGSIQFKHASFSYRTGSGEDALHDINLSINVYQIRGNGWHHRWNRLRQVQLCQLDQPPL